MSNNIFYYNQSVDLRVINTSCNGFTNSLDVLVESPADAYTGSGDTGLDPGFSGVFNYHLSPYSQLIDRGTTSPVGGLTDYDLDGLPRVNGDEVDIGCYELPLIFADNFETGLLNEWSNYP